MCGPPAGSVSLSSGLDVRVVGPALRSRAANTGGGAQSVRGQALLVILAPFPHRPGEERDRAGGFSWTHRF